MRLVPALVRSPFGCLCGVRSPHELSIIHYNGMGLVKLIVICFFFFPWAAIKLVLKKASGRGGDTETAGPS